MALELAGIKGTITVGLDGQDQTELATFEVPVTASFDGDGIATLHAIPRDTIIKAMADALTEAASRMLDSLPEAEVAE